MKQVKRIVLVGHCHADSSSLERFVDRVAGDGATVTKADDERAVASYTDGETLLLVNRRLDGNFASDSGVELIRRLAQREPTPRMMLISNYEDAQAEAQQAGAMRGFGKSEVGQDEAARALREALR